MEEECRPGLRRRRGMPHLLHGKRLAWSVLATVRPAVCEADMLLLARARALSLPDSLTSNPHHPLSPPSFLGQVIHMVNNTLPKLTCHTCRNKFHSGLLSFPDFPLSHVPPDPFTFFLAGRPSPPHLCPITRLFAPSASSIKLLHLLLLLIHLVVNPTDFDCRLVTDGDHKTACLYKWFNTSNKSACPLCQSPWYS